MRAVAILTAGVDTLYMSIRGHLIDGVLDWLGRVREDAGDEPVAFSLSSQDPDMVLRPHGWRGYRYWIHTNDFDLFIGTSDAFPPVYVQLRSQFIHAVGIESAVALVEDWLGRVLFPEGMVATASRADLFVDEQGWIPSREEMDRFVCRGIQRRMFEVPREAWAKGRRFSGFVFGKQHVVARIYDKTLQMAAQGMTWPTAIWSGRDEELPVWRIEFQFRRAALTTFGIGTPESLLHYRQDLWEYATNKWLTLRTRGQHADQDRWPVATVWKQLQHAVLGSPASGLVRELKHEADERRLAQGLVGYASSLDAMGGSRLTRALETARPVREYLARRGESYDEIVLRKRQTRLSGRSVVTEQP